MEKRPMVYLDCNSRTLFYQICSIILEENKKRVIYSNRYRYTWINHRNSGTKPSFKKIGKYANAVRFYVERGTFHFIRKFRLVWRFHRNNIIIIVWRTNPSEFAFTVSSRISVNRHRILDKVRKNLFLEK